MTYEEFLQLTEKNLKRFFPESFQERKVEIREVLKNNNIKLQGVYLSGSPSYTSVPLLYLESYYQELENGKKLEDVWQNIARDYQKCQETAITIDGISSKEWDYETIKKGLTVYVRNAQENVDFLADCPHEIREDLALVYGFHVLVDGEKDGSAIINYDRLKWLGVSEEQLKQDAWENMKQSNPPCFLDLQDMLAKMYFDEPGDVKAGSLEHLEDVDPNAMMYVLTNSNQVNGAVYMCDEEVMSLIAEKLGSDLIVIPSSIHETIILKETENMSVRELNAMVEAVNAEAVNPQERLGNYVYRFDREAQRLEKAVEQAEELLQCLRKIAPYIIVDCGSCIANDILSAIALMEADAVLRLVNCDLKSISYLSSQLPLLKDSQWDAEKQYKVASNVYPNEASEHIERVLGNVAFQIPHSEEVKAQVLEGNLLKELVLKDSKGFRKTMEAITKEVFGC